jgi:hypothetical protein
VAPRPNLLKMQWGSTSLPCGNKHRLFPKGAAWEANRASRDDLRGLELVEEEESRGEG